MHDLMKHSVPPLASLGKCLIIMMKVLAAMERNSCHCAFVVEVAANNSTHVAHQQSVGIRTDAFDWVDEILLGQERSP